MFSNALTKIGNGQKLTDAELNLIESRFVTKEKAEEKCPNAVRFFLTNKAVQEYNNHILSSAENKINSVAKDIYIGCHNAEQEAFVRQQLHKLSTTETGGLPYETIFVVDKHYSITTNIDYLNWLEPLV